MHANVSSWSSGKSFHADSICWGARESLKTARALVGLPGCAIAARQGAKKHQTLQRRLYIFVYMYIYIYILVICIHTCSIYSY